MLRIFIGYDPAEEEAYHVLTASIVRRARSPVSIVPLARHLLPFFRRPRGPLDSTDFSISRFLVPALCDFQGWALFMDCDMLVRCDITDLWLHAAMSVDKAVLVCEHNYTPRADRKFLGQTQTRYARKNWSSFMLFNNERCQALTHEYVETAPGLDLHQFSWIPDAQIGGLPLEWNWLVGEYEPNPDARVLHYTLGGPWFEEYASCDHADLWFQERALLSAPAVRLGA